MTRANFSPTSLVALLITVAIHLITNCRGSQRNGQNMREQIGDDTDTRDNSFLDNTTANKWILFNNWQCKAPAVFPSELNPLVTYISKGLCGRRILAVSPSSFTSNNSTVYTWTYRLETNSWTKVPSHQRSPHNLGNDSVLLTVCQSQVLYIAGSPKTNSSIWLFDGESDTWTEKALTGDVPPSAPAPIPTRSRYGFKYFVLFNRNSTDSLTCAKRYTIVCLNEGPTVVWKLHNIESTGLYVWQRISTQYTKSKDGIPIPIFINFYSAVADTERGFILVMEWKFLFKFDLYSSQWYLISKTQFSLYRDTPAFYLNRQQTFVLCQPDEIILYSFNTDRWTRVQMLKSTTFPEGFDTPGIQLIDHNQRRRKDLFFRYGGLRTNCVQALWQLRNESQTLWEWTQVEGPLISPLAIARKDSQIVLHSSVAVGDNIYVFTRRYRTLEVWNLDLNEMSWSCMDALDFIASFDYVRTTMFHNRVLVLLYSYEYFENDPISLQGYDLLNGSCLYKKYPNPYIDFNYLEPSAPYRIDYSLTQINSSTTILYGGTARDTYRCDMWSVTLNSPVNSLLRWSQIEPDCLEHDQDKRPHPRANYQTAAVNDSLFILGGMEENDTKQETDCYRDVWYYSLFNFTWDHAFVDDRSYDPNMCIMSAFAITKQLVVAFQSLARGSETRKFELWFYFISTKHWVWHSEMTSSQNFLMHSWRGRLLLLGDHKGDLLYTNIACPPGYGSSDIHNETCQKCFKGTYGAGDKGQCISCPTGLTTKFSGSVSPTNCSYCEQNYCKYGSCEVLLRNAVAVPFCQCQFGYSGSRCDDPKYILITLGSFVAVSLISLGLTALIRTWRRRRLREQSLRQQLQELTDVWQIASNEVTQLEVIGVGGYGQVYRARYRDMTVAMKMLLFSTNDEIMLEFEREIKFMQTIRHPNIVLFLGAGRTREGTPFIISEFVSRGSLRDLLSDASQSISILLKLEFCLDVAKGMYFLHTLSPPRVHRDLKCDNLLLSETNIVKIADFGLGTQIPNHCSDTRRRGENRNHRRSLSVPLLYMYHENSKVIGAARWCAPELSSSSNKNLTTAADVYSFAIVMWEIVTREIPFDHYKFDHQVMNAVEAGERPYIPEDCDPKLKSLIEDCWKSNYNQRPSFDYIKNQLTELVTSSP